MEWDWEENLNRESEINEYFQELLENINKTLSQKTDYELLMLALKKGNELNSVTEYFPAYDVAEKIFNMGWTPTLKQRNAIRNVLAFYIAQEQLDEFNDDEWP